VTCITLPFQFGALLLHFSLLGVHVTALVAVHNNKVMTIQPTLLVLFAPAALLAGVLAQVVFGKLLSARAKGILAVLCAAPSLAAVLLLFPAVHGSGAIDVSSISWDGPASLVFHVDALSLLFALMGTAIGLIVLIYSVSYMEEERAATRFYALMLTFIAGLVGLVFFANLLLMYVCWEVVGLCSFGLVGYWYKNPEAVRGARKVLLMTHLAGYGLLAALLELPSFFYIAAGFTSHSLFAEIGSAREAVLSISYNVVFLIAVIAIAVSQHTFRLEELAQPSTSLLRWLGTLAILACIPAKLHLNPFSVANAEQEIYAGPMTEYAGPGLALWDLSHGLEWVAMTGLVASLAMPRTAHWWIDVLTFQIFCMGVVLLLSALAAATARLTIDYAARLYWRLGVVVAILAVSSALLARLKL
jgi:formate hydrogenlyase subunit 3/multisubunit Na+/H+ antiporter MnhD subunit